MISKLYNIVLLFHQFILGTKPNIDSYSAFFDNLKANDTGLTKMLESNNITHVFCCGLVFDICVNATALHGADEGFEVFVIEDCCKPFFEAQVANTKRTLKNAGVRVIQSDELEELCGQREISFHEYIEGMKRKSKSSRLSKKVSSFGPDWF